DRAYSLARTKFSAFLDSMDRWAPLAKETSFASSPSPRSRIEPRPDQTAILVAHAAQWARDYRRAGGATV
ncbi:hypothetical protein QRT03_32000, partial [Actinomycetospora sp. Odt1-22]|nr:hypothetical protein [Actinomycetospora sp. Odt1-22]